MSGANKCSHAAVRFWQRIQEHVKHDEIAHFDRIALRELCRGCRWMDMIPKGLVSSYMYLYHCVKGLGCEDGEIIEKYGAILSTQFSFYANNCVEMYCELSVL